MPSRYAKRKINGKTLQAHRVIWEEAHGPIPDGYDVHHKNHTKKDNRLENLELLTKAEHSAHHNQIHPTLKTCVACGSTYEPAVNHRGRSRVCSAECARRRMVEYQLEHSAVRKLSTEQVLTIRERVTAGERRVDLATEYGVSKATLTRVTK